MQHPRWRLLLVLGVGLLVPRPGLRAQDAPPVPDRPPSHIAIPSESQEEPDSAERARNFSERLLRARGLHLAQEILKDPKLAQEILRYPRKFGINDPEALRNSPLLRNGPFPADLHDPELQRLMQKVLHDKDLSGLSGGALKPEQLEMMRKLFPKTESEPTPMPAPPPPAGGAETNPGGEPAAPPPVSGPAALAPSGGQAPETAVKREGKLADPENHARRARAARQFLRWANRLQEAVPSLRQSPSFRDALRSLDRLSFGAGENQFDVADFAGRIEESLSRFNVPPPLQGWWAERDWSWAKELAPTTWPQVSWPGGRPAWEGGGPHLAVPQVPSEGSWLPFLWTGVVLGVALALWKIVTVQWDGRRVAGRSAWQLGSWPVHPAAVRTRAELVQAFEYLSLLLLGPAARHWHHRAIAGRLVADQADGTDERRRAAEQLADLYERARYAPVSEPLPEAALAAARHDLCLLAGVAAA